MAAIKPMRLAYLIHTFPLFSLTFIVDEVVTMRDLGATIDLYAVRRPGPEEFPQNFQRYRDETIYALPVRIFSHGLCHLKWLFVRPWSYFPCLWFVVAARGCGWVQRIKLLAYLCEAVALADRIQPMRYDHLHVHFLFGGALVALFLNKLTGIRYSVTAHGSDFLVDRWLLTEKIHLAEFVRIGTCYNAKFIGDRIDPADVDKLFVLPFGVDHRRLAIDHASVRDLIAQRHHDPVRIINVGRLVWQKGQAVLIEAVNLLRQRGVAFQLEIIGEGELRAELVSLIAHSGLSDCVQMRGALPHAEVLAAMRESDIFAFSSVSEGFGIVLLEAMLCGLAVVAPAITGVSEIVTDGQTGYLYHTHTASALADSLEQLICDAALRRRYQINALDDVLVRFDHTDKVRQLYNRMASCRAG